MEYDEYDEYGTVRYEVEVPLCKVSTEYGVRRR